MLVGGGVRSTDRLQLRINVHWRSAVRNARHHSRRSKPASGRLWIIAHAVLGGTAAWMPSHQARIRQTRNLSCNLSTSGSSWQGRQRFGLQRWQQSNLSHSSSSKSFLHFFTSRCSVAAALPANQIPGKSSAAAGIRRRLSRTDGRAEPPVRCHVSELSAGALFLSRQFGTAMAPISVQ